MMRLIEQEKLVKESCERLKSLLVAYHKIRGSDSVLVDDLMESLNEAYGELKSHLEVFEKLSKGEEYLGSVDVEARGVMSSVKLSLGLQV